ncbi:MAG: DUF4331 family protein, partial [Myxococcales bacterium]|nr:DUF4331 family protein [Myxococcales bacterium]
AGFPNGRKLEDQAIDITLAVLLLDLNVHSPADLLGVSQSMNDVPFANGFHYLAPPH